MSQAQLEAEGAQLQPVVTDHSQAAPQGPRTQSIVHKSGHRSMLGCQLGPWLPVRLPYQRLQTLPCLVGGRKLRHTWQRLCAACSPPTQPPPAGGVLPGPPGGGENPGTGAVEEARPGHRRQVSGVGCGVGAGWQGTGRLSLLLPGSCCCRQK